jgi:glycosyltransferase involved in cell wall biosynthesis
MLDTIAWDVLYPAGAGHVAPVWRFIARHADALLYISQFTRDRFRTRFPPDPQVAEQVTLLSLLPEEHIDPLAQSQPMTDDILVFGNEYDHKDLRSTARLLADAFPFNRLVVFGTSEALTPNMLAIPTGKLEDAALHRLLATARVIVYPSYYEGFGLPVVEGLAYGRPVLVRHSPLWTEIAGRSRLPGDLIEYDDAASLVEGVGRALSGLPTAALERGVQLEPLAGH